MFECLFLLVVKLSSDEDVITKNKSRNVSGIEKMM
jgi:hypothetical protein